MKYLLFLYLLNCGGVNIVEEGNCPGLVDVCQCSEIIAESIEDNGDIYKDCSCKTDTSNRFGFDVNLYESDIYYKKAVDHNWSLFQARYCAE